MTAMTGKEKSEALRARRKAQGLKEVRSIWAAPEHHSTIKAQAKKLTKGKK